MFTERRQTMLFSATTTSKTEALTRLALKKEPVYVGVDDTKDMATVEGLEQGKGREIVHYVMILYCGNFIHCLFNNCLHLLYLTLTDLVVIQK